MAPRFASLAFALLPVIAAADDFTLDMPPTDVTAFPDGALVTRMVSVDLPAGTHRLILPDMPEFDDGGMPTGYNLTGGSLSGFNFYPEFPGAPLPDTDQIAAARAKLDRLTDDRRDLQDRAQSLRLASDAADMQIRFLGQLGEAEGLPTLPVEDLQALTRMIGQETKSARDQALIAETRASDLDTQIENLDAEIRSAERALEMALRIPDEKDLPTLVANVHSAGGPMTLSITTFHPQDGAGWMPSYELRLVQGDTPAVKISRRAVVFNSGHENWNDVRLTLATTQPYFMSDDPLPAPLLRRIKNKNVQKRMPASDSELSSFLGTGHRTEVVELAMAPIMSSESNGIDFSYGFEQRVSIPADTALALDMDQFELPARIYARAVPDYQEKAVLAAEITNSGDTHFLPSDVSHYYNGALLTRMSGTPQIASGAKAVLLFGPIHGLTLTRTVLDRQEGDRGVISKSNHQEERVSIEVENLTGQSWDVELYDRVPYSEQEDLAINWSAAPNPSEEDIDGQRGVLRWDFPIEPGQTRSIRLDTTLTWPEGYVLH